jgi:hypothetical protein
VTQERPYIIEPWRQDHDATAFSSGMATIDRYIKEQAHRDMSCHASLVLVLTEPGQKIVRAYYALSSLGVVFAELPEKTQKKLPRYPQIGATLLSRLGVDRLFSRELEQRFGEKPRLGELLLFDAQRITLRGANETSGTAMMVVDAEEPTPEELAAGIRDPIAFYTQYGFQPFPGNPRRFFKLTRVMEKEFQQA